MDMPNFYQCISYILNAYLIMLIYQTLLSVACNLIIRSLFFPPYALRENRAGGETRAGAKVKKIMA
jgi:hypothetical protein